MQDVAIKDIYPRHETLGKDYDVTMGKRTGSPVVVKINESRYELIWGQQFLSQAEELDHDTIICKVLEP